MNIIENDIKLAEKSIYTAEIENGKSCSFPNDINGMPYNNGNTGKSYFSGFPSKCDTACECYTALHNDGKLVSKATDCFLVSNFIIGVNLNLPAVGMPWRVSA
jgi:hypothetical protein